MSLLEGLEIYLFIYFIHPIAIFLWTHIRTRTNKKKLLFNLKKNIIILEVTWLSIFDTSRFNAIQLLNTILFLFLIQFSFLHFNCFNFVYLCICVCVFINFICKYIFAQFGLRASTSFLFFFFLIFFSILIHTYTKHVQVSVFNFRKIY